MNQLQNAHSLLTLRYLIFVFSLILVTAHYLDLFQQVTTGPRNRMNPLKLERKQKEEMNRELERLENDPKHQREVAMSHKYKERMWDEDDEDVPPRATKRAGK